MPVVHLASGDLVSLHSLSFLWVSGRRRRYSWRFRLPPQSFLPVGIGEATPPLLAISSPSTVFPSCGYRGGDAVTPGDLVSLHSPSFLWVSGRRRRYSWRSRLPPQSFGDACVWRYICLAPCMFGDVYVWRRPSLLRVFIFYLCTPWSYASSGKKIKLRQGFS